MALSIPLALDRVLVRMNPDHLTGLAPLIAIIDQLIPGIPPPGSFPSRVARRRNDATFRSKLYPRGPN